MESELTGMWWLPGRQEEAVAGTLALAQPRDTALRLVGSLDQHNYGSFPHYPIILGLSQDGKEITLQDANLARRTMSFPGFASQEYQVETVYVGLHAEHPEELTFQGANLKYRYLAEWVGSYPFQIDIPTGTSEYSVSYVPQVPMRIPLPQGVLSIVQNLELADNPREIRLYHSVALEVEVEHAMEQMDWNKLFIRPLGDFLTLACGTPTPLQSLVLASSRRVQPLASGQVLPIPITVYSQHTDEKSDTEQSDKLDKVFSYSELGTTAGATIARWLEVSPELEAIRDLYFGIRRSSRIRAYQCLLDLTRALEAYHRLRYRNEELPPREHAERVDAILAATPADFRDWLGKKLEYSNEPRLQQRLNELISANQSVMSPWASSSTKKKALVGRVVRARNRLTHLDAAENDRPDAGRGSGPRFEYWAFSLRPAF